MRKLSFKNFIFLIFLGFPSFVRADLRLGFYDKSCPKAEKIVFDYVRKKISIVPTLAAPLLRMHFHDCFVRGCDASVLINSTIKNQAEKSAIPNLTLRGFGFIDTIKSLVEKECPDVVSCADILSLTARDAVVVVGGPFWNVPTGRRDGLLSNATEALINIPAPTFNFTSLQNSFANKGLNVTDLVILSGNSNESNILRGSFATTITRFDENGGK